MTFEIAFVLGVLLVALVLFAREWIPPDLVAVGIVVALCLGGILDPAAAFGSFGNESLLTIAAMFVLAAGLTRTGAVSKLGRVLVDLGGRGERRVLLLLMVAAAVPSAFVNNTPIVVILLPTVLEIAIHSGISASKLLLPLSYATIAGGMCTVIGTSTNILVSTLLPRFDLPRLGLFEPLPLALIGAVLTFAYVATIGRRLLPERTSVTTAMRSGKLTDYVTELVLPRGSPLAGATIGDAILQKAPAVQILLVVRRNATLGAYDGRLVLREGDALIVRGDANAVLQATRVNGVQVAGAEEAVAANAPAGEPAARPLEARARSVTLAELLIPPGSPAIGARVRDLPLHRMAGAAVLGVQRRGLHLRHKIGDLVLRLGDVLLVQVDEEALPELREAPEFLLLEGVQETIILSHRAKVALAILGGFVVLASLGIEGLPISVLAVAAALTMVLTGCVGVRQAYRAIDLPILVLIAGTLALGKAMERTGAAAWLARGLVDLVEPLGHVALLSAIYLVCNVLTALISNAGAAILMLPIALQAAAAEGLAPLPFVIAVMFAASIDFSTPFGYQTNTLVYGPGGYRFLDYVRIGGPLNVLWWLLATALIPVFWPLRPEG